MSIQIKLKNSVVQDSTPSTSDLPVVGEIALNANINSIGGFMRASDNSIVKIFGPGSLSTPTATTTVSGISELATNTETTTGTATNRVVTPAGLNAVTVAERTTSNTNYVAKAGSTMTGVLTATAGSNSAPAINFGDSDSGIFGGTNTVSLAAGGTTRLTADTGVSVVGTLAVTGAITSTSDLTIADKIIHSGDTNTAIRFPAADTVSVETGGSEAFRVDSSGRLLVGTSSARVEGNGFASSFQIEGTGFADSSQIICRNQANNAGANLILQKSRGSTLGSQTILLNNDTVGSIVFEGSDGVNTDSIASILAAVDGTPGTNDMPGRLVFSTTADGAASSTTRLTIDSAGLSTFTGDLTISSATPILNFTETNANPDYRILTDGGEFVIQNDNSGSFATKLKVTTSGVNITGTINSTGNVGISNTNPSQQLDAANNLVIGSTSDADSGITLVSTTSGQGLIHFSDANSGNARFDGFLGYEQTGRFLKFGTAQAERMRIDSSGNVGIGTTSPSKKLDVSGEFRSTAIFSSGATSGAASANQAVFDYNTSDTRILSYNSSGSSINLFTNPSGGSLTSRLSIDSSGKVGIGTTSPAVNLDVSATSGTTQIYVRNTATSGQAALGIQGKNSSGTTRVMLVKYDNNDSFRFATAQAVPLTFSTSDAVRLTVNSDGNVGIGTISPSYKLEVSAETGISGDVRFLTGSRHKFVGGGSGNNLELGTYGSNNTSRNIAMVMDSAGSVGIGTTSPSQRVQIAGDSGDACLSLLRSNAASNNNAYGHVFFENSSDVTLASISARRQSASDDAYLQFNTTATGGSNTEKMRITSTGKVGIGTTSPSQELTVAGSDPVISVQEASVSSQVDIGTGTSTGFINIQKADGTRTIQLSGSGESYFNSGGNVGIGTSSPSSLLTLNHATNPAIRFEDSGAKVASINAEGSATNIASFEGKALVFATSTSSSFSERMRIDTAGNVGIGTSSPSFTLDCNGSMRMGDGNAGRRIQFSRSGLGDELVIGVDGHGAGDANDAVIQSSPSFPRPLIFGTNNAERMRLLSDGALVINSTARPVVGTELLGVNGGDANNNVGIGSRVGHQFGIPYFASNGSDTNSTRLMRFASGSGGNTRGTITFNGSNVVYGTTSDYRLKKNIQQLSNGITKIKQLNPISFDWIKESDNNDVMGFLAHEVQEVVSQAISGTKDEVDSEGNPEYQEMDYGSITPLIVAALKELITRVETLEAA